VDSYLWSTGTVIIWIAFGYKVWNLRQDRQNVTLRLLCVALLYLALAFTFATPITYVGFDRIIGVPNLSRLMMQTFGVAYTLVIQRLLLSWIYPVAEARRRSRRWLWLCVPVLFVQVALFAGAPIHEEASNFAVRYGREPSVMALILVLGVCLTLTTADIVRLCWKFASLSGRPYLRVGLRLTGIGAGAGLVHWVVDVSRQFVRLAFWPREVVPIPDSVEQMLFTLSSFIGAALVATGLTIPAWGPRLSAALAWFGRYRAYRQLRPLWIVLYQASPEIALEVPSGRSDRWWAGDLDYRLVRRVVEIRDGRLALRPYLDGPATERASATARQAGLAGLELAAAVEAAAILEAIQAKRRGKPPADPGPDDIAGGADLNSEADWLGRVARAMSTSRG
jgi:hypothetical protein